MQNRQNSETSKRIAVVIPVYNSRRYLIQTVESIFNQSYQKIDIVLVDDGSTDGSSLLVTIHSREMKGHGKNTMLESVF